MLSISVNLEQTIPPPTLTGELEEWWLALLCSIAQSNSSSLSHPCGVTSSQKWHALCFSELPLVFWSSAAWIKDYAGFTDIFEFFFFFYGSCYAKYFFADWLWPEASCRAPSLCFCHSLSQTKPLPFTIEPENSHQCSGSVCAQFNTHRNTTCCTELVFYSVPLTKCQPVNGIAKEHPLCVITVAFLLPTVLCTIRF